MLVSEPRLASDTGLAGITVAGWVYPFLVENLPPSPFWGSFGHRRLFGRGGAEKPVGPASLSRCLSPVCRGAVPSMSRCCPEGQGRRLAKTKWFPVGFDLETVWVFRSPPARRNKTTKKRNALAVCYAALNWITSAPLRSLSR